MMKCAVSAALLALIVLAYGPVRADEAKFMTARGLMAVLGKPNVVVIDVRTAHDWDKSDRKIKGAVREEGMKFGAWKDKYPKDKTIVLYCA